MSQLYQPQSRPNSLLIPPNPAFLPASPRGGILLNASRPLSLSPNTPSYGFQSALNTPRSPSPLSAALSPETERKMSESRKIRFAPLPEPRRELMVDEDGVELPCQVAPDATAFPTQSPGAGPSVTLDRTDSLVTDSGASTTSTDADTQSQISRKRAKRNSLLKLFGVKSGSIPKRTSTSSLPSADANGTIGGIPVPGLGLFRPTSRESWSGELSGYTSDNSIARRTSSPLRPSSAGGRLSQPNYGSFGAPLMQSDGSRPQRMLNGRVYGARRAKERLQPLPSMEPEFSEWGYGGMGSVNTTGEYSKLQSKTSAVSGGDEDDDGSGMAWIKKRKEKREREEREKKEAEAAAEAAKAQEPRASTETTDSAPTVHAEPIETPTVQTPTGTAPPSRQNSTPLSPPRPRTVSSPPTRQNSTATVTPDRHHPTVVAVPAHRGRPEGTVLSSGVAMSPETSPERSSSGSSRRSSSDDEDAEESTGREDEEEEEEEEQKRKTALSAGIEKISRHHA